MNSSHLQEDSCEHAFRIPFLLQLLQFAQSLFSSVNPRNWTIPSEVGVGRYFRLLLSVSLAYVLQCGLFNTTDPVMGLWVTVA